MRKSGIYILGETNENNFEINQENYTREYYTVTYSSNDELNQIIIKKTPKEVIFTGDIFEKENYKIVSWNSKADGTGETYNLKEKYNIYEDLTVYAIWEENTVVSE